LYIAKRAAYATSKALVAFSEFGEYLYSLSGRLVNYSIGAAPILFCGFEFNYVLGSV